MAEWRYIVDGQEHGPVSSAEVRRLAAAGKIRPTDLLWRPGLAEWVPAAKIAGLFTGPPSGARAAAGARAPEPLEAATGLGAVVSLGVAASPGGAWPGVEVLEETEPTMTRGVVPTGPGTPFKVMVKRCKVGTTSIRWLRYRCDLQPGGAILTHKGKDDISLPVGTKVDYKGGSTFTLVSGGDSIAVRLAMTTKFTQSMTRDFVAFLQGRARPPVLSAYNMPWYFYLLVFLPIGAVVTAGLPVGRIGILFGGIPLGIVGAAIGVCGFIAQREKWRPGLRIAVAAVANIICYAVLMGIGSNATWLGLGGASPGGSYTGPSGGSPHSDSAVTDLDYSGLFEWPPMWDDLHLSLETRIKLLRGGDEQVPAGLDANKAMTPEETNAAWKNLFEAKGRYAQRCLTAAENDAFRQLYVSEGLAHVVMGESRSVTTVDINSHSSGPGIATSVSRPPYKDSNGYWDRANKARLARPCPWVDERAWSSGSYPTPVNIIETMPDALRVEASPDPWVRVQALEWIGRAKVVPEQRPAVIAALRPYLFPIGTPAKDQGRSPVSIATVFLRWASPKEADDLVALAHGPESKFAPARDATWRTLVATNPEAASRQCRADLKAGTNKSQLLPMLEHWRNDSDQTVADFASREIEYQHNQVHDTNSPADIVFRIESGADRRQRLDALRYAMEHPLPPEFRAKLRAALWSLSAEEDTGTRDPVLNAFMTYAEADDIPRLKGLADKHSDVKDVDAHTAAALVVILRVDPAQGIPLLEKYMPTVKNFAVAKWLGACKEQGEPAALAALASSLPALREQGVVFLRDHGTANALAPLARLQTGDPDRRVQGAAKNAIKAINDRLQRQATPNKN